MSKELAKTYDPKDIEDRLYKKWEDNKYFHAEVDRSKKSYALPLVRKETGVVKMTDREKKELIEAEETILQLFFNAYERAMKYTKGNINLSLRMAAMLVSAMVHDQTESKSFQFLWQMGRDNK